MKSIQVGLILAVAVAGCATDEADAGSSRGGLTGGAAGSPAPTPTAPSDFGNAESFVPPPLVANAAISGGGCKAGHYVGSLEGWYLNPLAWGIEVPITTDAPPLFPPPAGEPTPPGFEFWLTASEEVTECGGDQEFCFDFKVEGGKARGLADGLFPFEMDINGQLDCSSGRFFGLIENGRYEVAGVPFFFEGTLESSYDADNAQFFDGAWEVIEPADNTSGGDGSWYTAFLDEV